MKGYIKPKNQGGTMYSETERMLTLKHLDTYNLNPLAFWPMMENYIQFIHPLPVKTIVTFETGDDVELYIYAVGNLSTKFWGDPRKLDVNFVNLFTHSYHVGVSPLPVSFQIMDAIEVHLRTPKTLDSELKNPTRNIFNPTGGK